MPVHNGEDHLEEAIVSVLSQTLGDFEFIIVNDGSTDSTTEMLQGLSSQDTRIVVLQEPRIGLAEALNLGLRSSSAEIVARMDADDRSHAERFREQFAYLNRRQDVAILGTQIRHIDASGTVVSCPRFPTSPRSVARRMRVHDVIAHPSVMFRRSAIRKLGGYRAFPLTEDLDLWLRALDAGLKLSNLSQALLDYRVRPSGQLHVDDSRRRSDQVTWAFYVRLASNYRRSQLPELLVPYPELANTHAIRTVIEADSTFPELKANYNLRLAPLCLALDELAPIYDSLPSAPMSIIRRNDFANALYELSWRYFVHRKFHVGALSLLRALRACPTLVVRRLLASLSWRRTSKAL